MLAFGGIAINLLSIVLLVVAGVIAVQGVSFKRKFIYVLSINCILEIFKLQGFFIAFGTTEVSYEDFWMVVVLVFSIPMLVRNNYDFKLVGLCVLMLVAALGGILMELVWPYQGDIIAYDTKGAWDGYIMGKTQLVGFKFSVTRFILYFVRILMYVVSAYIIKTNISIRELKDIVSSISKVSMIYIWYGLFEFVVKTFLQSSVTHTINKLILGLGVNAYSEMRLRDGIPMLQCFTREPSHYTQALFYIAVILLINKKIKNEFRFRNLKSFFVIILIMLVSRSFAGLIYVGILSVVFIMFSKKVGKNFHEFFKRIRGLIIAAVGVIIAGTIFVLVSPESYLGDRLLNSVRTFGVIIDGTWQTYRLSSEMARMVSIYETFMDFINRPIFGLGLGVESSHSGFVNMLADVGIVGVIAWYKLSFYKIHKKSYDKLAVILLLFLANIVAGVGLMFFSSVVIIIIESTSAYVLREKSEVYKLYESIAH